MAKVEFRGVTKSFGEVKVIHGIDCAIDDGEFIVILGPSGCGKSTLLRIVAGLERATAGQVWIGGACVNDVDAKDRNIAMVFQNYALYPHMSVYDNMAYGLKIRGMAKADIERRVQEAAKMLELTPLLSRKPKQLSGGQRQRVAMGRAIVRQPAVFLFDEPLSNLDAKLRAQTRLEIQKLHAELGVTSLFVTHDQVEAMTLAQRMIVMNAGRIEQIGTPEQVYGRPASTFVAGFIGSPPMNLLTGRADGSRFTVGGQTLVLPEPAPRAGALMMGVRPEHAQVGEHGGWPMQVELLEMLGAERLVYGKLGGDAAAPFTLRVEGRLVPPRPGDTLHLQVPAEGLHWFDPVSGQRV